MKKMSSVLLVLALIGSIGSAVFAQETMNEEDLMQWAMAFTQHALVIDGHCDTVGSVLRGTIDISVRNSKGHMDIPRMFQGGADAQFFACFTSPSVEGAGAIKSTLDMLDALHQVAEKDERFVIAGTADDILKAKREGKIACIPAIEGGHAIAGDIHALRMFRRLGVRYMTLTWNNSNELGDSSEEDQSRYGNLPHRGGLTDLGREVVREMNRIGMIVDVSHVHDDTFWDVIEVSTKPVIASHSCCWALNPVPRNMKDEMLRALARNGGVVGINYFSAFLSKEYAEAFKDFWTEARAEREELKKKYADDEDAFQREWRSYISNARAKGPKVTISLLVDHIDHVVKVAGIDHVGLGSDFDGISSAPEGLDDVTDLWRITAELRRRGYSEGDIRKILGENFLRVIRANDVE